MHLLEQQANGNGVLRQHTCKVNEVQFVIEIVKLLIGQRASWYTEPLEDLGRTDSLKRPCGSREDAQGYLGWMADVLLSFTS